MPVPGLNVMDMLRNQLKLKQLEIDALLAVTQAINMNTSSPELFKIFENTLCGQIGVQDLLLFTKNDNKWEKVINNGTRKFSEKISVEQDLLQFTKLTYLHELNGALPQSLSNFDILIPVFHKDNALAYLLISNPKVESYEPVEEKIKFVQTISNIITVAIENKRLFKKEVEQIAFQRELEVAAQVQSMLIPGKLPKNDLVNVAAIYLPHQNIGGDYYDFMSLSKGEFFFCIADISGKGIAAALLMANFQAQLRELTKRNPVTIEEYMQELNKGVLLNTRGEKFITLFLAKFNFNNRILKYVNAGHNPPILVNKNGYKLLDAGCTILGMFDELPFVKMGQIPIIEDTTIMCYTDGLTDLMNDKKQTIPLNEIIDFVKINQHEDADVLSDKLQKGIEDFKGEENAIDDITVLTVKIAGKKSKGRTTS